MTTAPRSRSAADKGPEPQPASRKPRLRRGPTSRVARSMRSRGCSRSPSSTPRRSCRSYSPGLDLRTGRSSRARWLRGPSSQPSDLWSRFWTLAEFPMREHIGAVSHSTFDGTGSRLDVRGQRRSGRCHFSPTFRAVLISNRCQNSPTSAVRSDRQNHAAAHNSLIDEQDLMGETIRWNQQTGVAHATGA